jgi:hypothetical protein
MYSRLFYLLMEELGNSFLIEFDNDILPFRSLDPLFKAEGRSAPVGSSGIPQSICHKEDFNARKSLIPHCMNLTA